MASAIEPPTRPSTIIGTASAKPIAPTASDDRVREYTCTATATAVIWLPIADSDWPTHSRRYSGDSRSGRMSANKRLRPDAPAFVTVTMPPGKHRYARPGR